MFRSNTDLLYQHEIHGPLVRQPDMVMETAYQNYFKGLISYRGIQRIENYPVPGDAFREAVTNAIVHRDYSTGIPIQIKVFPREVVIYNDGRLEHGWTIEDLIAAHRSQPHNPLIAGGFFRSGQIESWGRGLDRITEACRSWRKRDPVFDFKHGNEFSVTFFSDVDITARDTNRDTNKDTNKDTNRDTLSETQNELLKLMMENPQITAKQISDELDINERNVKKNIKALKDAGLIERVGTTRTGHWSDVDITAKDTNRDTNRDTNKDTNRDTNKDTNKDTNRDTLNETQNELLKLMIENPQITANQISDKLDINERNVKKNIKALKDADLIDRVGTTRTGHWIVK
jgi:ATP-dependent DNA helicase RecG